jgi:hypothetical protein
VATTEKAKPGEERTIVASWVSRALADEIKRHAEAERRSVSSVIRNAVDKPRSDEERRR